MRRMILNRLFITCFVLIVKSGFASGISEELIDMVNQSPERIVNHQRNHLAELIQNRQNIQKIEPEAELLNVLQSNATFSKSDFEKYYLIIFELGRFHPGNNLPAVAIQDSIVFTIIVSSLLNENREIKNKAFFYIEEYWRRDYIKEFSKSIKDAMRKNNLFYPKIVINCKHSVDEKKELLEKKNQSFYYYAALGKSEYEDSLIHLYKTTKKYKEKVPLISSLILTGTEKCINTLLASLNDTLIDYRYGYKQSIRMDILLALGHVFPNELLFSMDPLSVYYKCCGKIKKNEINDYLRSLEKWIHLYAGFSINLQDGTPLSESKIVD